MWASARCSATETIVWRAVALSCLIIRSMCISASKNMRSIARLQRKVSFCSTSFPELTYAIFISLRFIAITRSLFAAPSSALHAFEAERLLSSGLALCPVLQKVVDVVQSHVVALGDTNAFWQVLRVDEIGWRRLNLSPRDSHISAASSEL